jgi:hypothetical protein
MQPTFIRTRNEKLSVAMRVSNPDCAAVTIQPLRRSPQLQPDYTSNLQPAFETTVT